MFRLLFSLEKYKAGKDVATRHGPRRLILLAERGEKVL